MTRFITLHRRPSFVIGTTPAPIPMLVNVAHIVTASPAQAPEPDYRSFVSVLGGDGSDIQLADEFEHVQRLIVGDAHASSLDLEQAASLLRDALSGVELLASFAPNDTPHRLLRDRLNAALALIGGENTMAPTPAGEPTILDAADVAKLRTGDGVSVYDRQFKRRIDGYITRRGDAPAGVEIRLPHPDGGFGRPIIEHFDNTGRSVATVERMTPDAAWPAPCRFYIVDEFAPGVSP